MISIIKSIKIAILGRDFLQLLCDDADQFQTFFRLIIGHYLRIGIYF